MTFPVPPNEDERLRALSGYGAVDTAPEPELDRIVRLAATLFDAPIALVSLIGETRNFFKARVGVGICESPRDISFCAHALVAEDVLVIPDAAADPRFAANPLVVSGPALRFYAGAPLVTSQGHAIGTLCVIDGRPRPDLSDRERDVLRALAAIAMDALNNRMLKLTKRAALQLARTTADAIVCTSEDGVVAFWNRAAERTFGWSRDEAVGRPLDLLIPERFRAAHNAGFARVAGGGARHLGDKPVEIIAARKDGTELPVELSLAVWRDEAGMQAGAIIRDVSERRRAQERLHHLTHFDRLTGLPNRVSFIESVSAAIGAGRGFTLFKMGLDRFKDVNATLGLQTGDELLKRTAERIEDLAGRLAGPGALVARLGADEFGLLLTGCVEEAVADAAASRLLQSFEEPLAAPGGGVRLAASVGVVLCPAGPTSDEADAMLENGLLALRHAKSEGGGRRQMFRPRLRDQLNERRRLEGELKAAFDKGEFELFYQPQVRLSDRAIVGAEALLRWRHPERGLLAPAAFLSTLERSALAAPVGDWAIGRGCRFAAAMEARGRPIRVGVNLFPAQFRAGDLVATVDGALAASGLRPDLLELEITETTVLQVDDHVIGPLSRLRERGVGIAFDDYGTGYASLSLLKRYPLTRLKIDREFVRDLEANPDDAAIVRAVLAMGASLNFEVIAEGIETDIQALFLRLLGCGEAQGYLFGRPMPAASLEEVLFGTEARGARAERAA